MEETLYLTVNLIDRFLALQPVVRKKLQLVGVTAMLLASKYEEVSVPVVEDLVLISDRAYSRQEVLQMVSIHCGCFCHQWYMSTFDLYRRIGGSNVIWSASFHPAGEIDGQCLTIQLIISNPLCLYEEVSQSCWSRQKGKLRNGLTRLTIRMVLELMSTRHNAAVALGYYFMKWCISLTSCWWWVLLPAWTGVILLDRALPSRVWNAEVRTIPFSSCCSIHCSVCREWLYALD